ncbi:unnamed protein product [Ixodes hexagonus]
MPSTGGQVAPLSAIGPQEDQAGQTVKDQYKLVVLGGARVGKTAIVHQFLYDEFPVDYFATVEEVRTLSGLRFLHSRRPRSMASDFASAKLVSHSSDATCLYAVDEQFSQCNWSNSLGDVRGARAHMMCSKCVSLFSQETGPSRGGRNDDLHRLGARLRRGIGQGQRQHLVHFQGASCASQDPLRTEHGRGKQTEAFSASLPNKSEHQGQDIAQEKQLRRILDHGFVL